MQIANCPYCEAGVGLDSKPKMGQRVTCGNCKTELEVVWLDPVELDWPMDSFEDEDEYEYDYDYDEDN
ncbi:MAG: lysine biosynthesis protein LysW [Anaerolineae bacterium]|nr:lysine biosynthesis protein LysW [Anaerolineae bacterium]